MRENNLWLKKDLWNGIFGPQSELAVNLYACMPPWSFMINFEGK